MPDYMITAGYGNMYLHGPPTSQLQKLIVTKLPIMDCAEIITNLHLSYILSTNQICIKAETYETQSGVYQGVGGTCMVNIFYTFYN